MSNINNLERITVDIRTLQEMLNLGKNKAMEIGNKSGAVIHLSNRRTLYYVDKVKKYMESLTEEAQIIKEDNNND